MPSGRPFQRVINYPLGRKEIVMFFYLYAIIELLAFLLDSNLIPTANVTYPVNSGVPHSFRSSSLTIFGVL